MEEEALSLETAEDSASAGWERVCGTLCWTGAKSVCQGNRGDGRWLVETACQAQRLLPSKQSPLCWLSVGGWPPFWRPIA